jgi:NADH dehydrogenase/NADH:ubiquinone oxidoreductase subunit G
MTQQEKILSAVNVGEPDTTRKCIVCCRCRRAGQEIRTLSAVSVREQDTTRKILSAIIVGEQDVTRKDICLDQTHWR